MTTLRTPAAVNPTAKSVFKERAQGLTNPQPQAAPTIKSSSPRPTVDVDVDVDVDSLSGADSESHSGSDSESDPESISRSSSSEPEPQCEQTRSRLSSSSLVTLRYFFLTQTPTPSLLQRRQMHWRLSTTDSAATYLKITRWFQNARSLARRAQPQRQAERCMLGQALPNGTDDAFSTSITAPPCASHHTPQLGTYAASMFPWVPALAAMYNNANLHR